jgi:alcohol dehydrogenase class IV
VEGTRLPDIAASAAKHPALANTPDPPDEEELTRLLHEAL